MDHEELWWVSQCEKKLLYPEEIALPLWLWRRRPRLGYPVQCWSSRLPLTWRCTETESGEGSAGCSWQGRPPVISDTARTIQFLEIDRAMSAN
jgi:hypothetical protein